jgi:Domain of unknown function (DUF4124)
VIVLVLIGAGGGIRTPDPRITNALLYQLSYAGGAAKYTDSMTRFGWFFAAMLLPMVAVAQAYRWVDDKGQVHYSQVPPPGKDAQPVGPPPPPAANPNQDSLDQSMAEAKETQGDRQKSADRAFQEKSNKEAQCRDAREGLAYMDAKTAKRMGTPDNKGNVRRLTQEEFQARRAELQQILAGCG